MNSLCTFFCDNKLPQNAAHCAQNVLEMMHIEYYFDVQMNSHFHYYFSINAPSNEVRDRHRIEA